MDDRQNLLGIWVKRTLSLATKESPRLDPVSGDASFRKYYRLCTHTGSLIVVDAPPQTENSRQFALVREMLDANGLTVPELLAADYENGFMIVSDFGNESFFQVADDQVRIDQLYSCAIKSLLKIQSIEPGQWDIPRFDAAFILRELAIFEEWFVDGFLEIEQFEGFSHLADNLVSSALQQPQVVMHRDYHSRNLMVVEAGTPGILDFQDAVLGPVSYDLASLLMDCYIEWPRQFVEAKIDEYLRGAREQGILQVVDKQQFMGWFDLIALQRHLKCVGIFCRLFKRDQKSHYLQDIPRVLGYITRTSARYHELQSFHNWLCEAVMPAVILIPELKGDRG
jgi:aminoglycoside/choline kinase family phosphotransferase